MTAEERKPSDGYLRRLRLATRRSAVIIHDITSRSNRLFVWPGDRRGLGRISKLEEG